MKHRDLSALFVTLFLALTAIVLVTAQGAAKELAISWADNMLTIDGDHLPGKQVQIWYIEAYCRPGSTDREWRQTTIGHTTRLVASDDQNRKLELECRLNDGVIVRHTITAGNDEIDFRLIAKNPTTKRSQAHWAQPCLRVDKFTGHDQQGYLAKSFVFLGGRLQRMPTQPWAIDARYTPGQVWAPKNVNRADVNPRPLNPLAPDNGLIGCFSAADKMILAMAWEPFQELFQGVIVCLHADFRIGGLEPGEEKQIRGKIYLVPNDINALLSRYKKDFSEHDSE